MRVDVMTCLVTCFPSWKHKTFKCHCMILRESRRFSFQHVFLHVFLRVSSIVCEMFSFLLSCGKFSGHRRKLWDATADPKPGDLGKLGKSAVQRCVTICDDLDGISMHFARALHANKHLGDQLSSLRVTWLTSHLYLIVLQMSSQMSFYDHLKCHFMIISNVIFHFTREVNEIAEWPLPPRLSAL